MKWDWIFQVSVSDFKLQKNKQASSAPRYGNEAKGC